MPAKLLSARATRTVLAAAATVIALAGCGGSSSGISAQVHRDYMAGCTRTRASSSLCECVFTQLTAKQGYNNEAKFKALSNNTAEAVSRAGEAALACKA